MTRSHTYQTLRPTLRPPLGLVAGLVLLSVGSGCSGCEPRVDHFRICTVSSQQGGAVTSDEIRIRQGAVVAVKLIPFDKEGKLMEETTMVSAYVEHAGILGVSQLHYETEACQGAADAPWYFVFYGIAAGETTLTMHANGTYGAQIPVVVTAP